MRVLFTTTPGMGHLGAMRPLARAFAERGDDVRWAAGADACAHLTRDGFEATPAGLTLAQGQAEFHRRFPEYESLAPPRRPDFMFPKLFGAVRAAPMLHDLLPLARDLSPDLVVRDAAEFAGPIVAAALGVRAVTHSFGAPLPSGRVASIDAELAPLWASLDLQARPYGGSYESLYLDIYPPSLQAGSDRSRLGVTQLLRPTTSAISGDEDSLPGWVTSASGGAPLVYVTLGTVFSDVGVLSTIVAGLGSLPVRVVVTVGPEGDPTAIGEQPPHVHVTRYIAQDRLLPHCALVVSHAGSGTFLASLAHGIPHLCVPQAADQFLNADACAASGAGLVAMPGAFAAGDVRAMAARLLSESSFRVAASRIASELADMPSPDEVAALLASGQ